MEFLDSILESPQVQAAAAAVLAAAGLALAAFFRELAVRLSARLGAIHAESEAQTSGAKGADKMDVAVAHNSQTLPLLARASPTRTRRLIEGVLPEVRKSMAPPAPKGPPN